MRIDRFVLGFIALLLTGWQLGVVLGGAAGKAPSPFGMAQALLVHVADNTLPSALLASLSRVLLGFAVAALIGLPLGLLMGLVRPVARAVVPFLDGLRAIAPIAWIPVAVLWLGVRGDAAIFIVAYAALLPLSLSAYQAVLLVDRRLVQAATVLGAGPWLRLRSVILPGCIPVLITACRIAMGFAWASIVAAELAVGVKVGQGSSGQGIGQMMVETLYVKRDVDTLALCMLCVGLVSLAIDALTRALGRALSPWTH